ncbi:iron chaperone [Liquorilactobacillus capillatus]|uniref:Uncharacterized protein n=1 Tax=Liquorilactobacillus capillatus DSM 19910 TaxID=1423731 RepID=A0A0R1MEM0_9LACO|nr:DUF1801 domain-containing protein [Liquorilactobacillus capillatus]KRL03570.1 hypothetical protein FC81_GL001825 [Liquorilactobacillus capillatus DSM 19910]
MTQKSFSEFERAAMKERAQELRAESNKKRNPAADLLEKIAELPSDEAFIASNLHKLVHEVAPTLQPKTWYGMPAYADNTGQVVLFFQAASKFKERYNTLGFNGVAALDSGKMWPTAYALTVWDDEVSHFIRKLIIKAISKN